tara:strand:+ start:335 stop:577 length:243 start_codon:yes stop_codon:yes gene_type:complete
MLELVIPIGVAAATGFSILVTRIHSRVYELDRRVDNFELRIAENYLSKSEFSSALDRVEQHMVRIENKLDRIANRDSNVK